MASRQRRVRILCEDRRTERFIRRLCQRFHVRVEGILIAPSGKGAASAWIRSNYAAHVRKRRSKSFQANLGLLVVVDGDNLGGTARLRELAEQLETAQIEPRGPTESIAVFVPTWSVETWLAHLSGVAGVDESTAWKEHARTRALWGDGATEANTVKIAVAAWNGADPALPSLQDAYTEAPRVGLGPA